MPEVVIVRPVNLPVVLVWAVAVHRAALIEPGSQIKQRAEVAAVERHLLHCTLINYRIQRAGCCLKSRGRSLHLNRFGLLSNAELDGQARDFADRNLDLIEHIGLEALLCDRERIEANRQISEGKVPGAGSLLVVAESGAQIDDLHSGRIDNRARWIGYAA